jgi:hypothetical protein
MDEVELRQSLESVTRDFDSKPLLVEADQQGIDETLFVFDDEDRVLSHVERSL